MSNKPIQKIIFGSPGTGKSHKIKEEIIPIQLEITDPLNMIRTVFHPEYTYGDFMGKLMPLTDDNHKVSYRYYTGHFLKSLGKAYKNIIQSYIEWEEKQDKAEDEYKKDIGITNKKNMSENQIKELETRRKNIEREHEKNVVLVIEELNRGNSAAIFGTVFQLLDRDKHGWSEYSITLSDLEKIGLLQEIGFSTVYTMEGGKITEEEYKFDGKKCTKTKYEEYLEYIFQDANENNSCDRVSLLKNQIKLPPNLSILATMNTSDNSIYFMDNAFKRRWDWEFINVDDQKQKDQVKIRKVNIEDKETCDWTVFVDNLNKFICDPKHKIRKVEDKQIGYFFINEDVITEEQIKNKLMFFLWDSVFSNNRDPLTNLLGMEKGTLVTFGQFTKEVKNFVEAIIKEYSASKSV